MGPGTSLKTTEKGMIIAYDRQGLSVQEIHTRMNRSINVIIRFLRDVIAPKRTFVRKNSRKCSPFHLRALYLRVSQV